MDASLVVGDAAGRPNDFAGTDHKFAENLSLKFVTPEVRQLFLHMFSFPAYKSSGIFPQAEA